MLRTPELQNLRTPEPALVLPHDPHDHALHLDLRGVDEHRQHRRVGWLESHAAVVAIELLQGDVRPADECNDHFAVLGRFPVLDDDEIAVADLLVDHRVAPDAQDVGFATANQIFGDGDHLVRGDGLDGNSGGDVAEHWQLDRAMPGSRREQFDRTAAVPGSTDEALLLEIGQVLVDRGERRKTETPADFFETRRVAMLLNELLQVVQNLALAFRQWLHEGALPEAYRRRLDTLRKEKAKINLKVRTA